jgi:hypothetical protein
MTEAIGVEEDVLVGSAGDEGERDIACPRRLEARHDLILHLNHIDAHEDTD